MAGARTLCRFPEKAPTLYTNLGIFIRRSYILLVELRYRYHWDSVAGKIMKLYTTLSGETVFIGVSAPDKQTLLRDLVQRMAVAYSYPDPDQLVEIILEREAEISTGIGEGVAIPHANQAPVEKTMLAAATLSPPLEYDAIDGQPVELIFLVITGSGKAGLHLKILARISRMSHKKELLRQLIESATPAEFLQHLSGFEDRFTDISV